MAGLSQMADRLFCLGDKMSNQTFTSTAQVVCTRGENTPNVQILIDDVDLFNHLPGKYERYGVKTLSGWPFFVTAILNVPDDPGALKCHGGNLQIRETAALPEQIPFFDLSTTANPTGYKARKHKVQRTLAEIRRLHDQLNSDLYAKPTERPVVHSPSDAFQIVQTFMGFLDHEELWVVNLDTRNRVMSLTKLYQGSVNSSQVRIGEVFRQAIIENAPGIIIAHNHPSGDVSPSPEDVSVTRAIVQAGKLLEIDVLDHIVVSKDKFTSLKEKGLGFGG
jgi:RadC-like JAB domain